MILRFPVVILLLLPAISLRAEALTIVSPGGTVPTVLFAEKREVYYGEKVRAHRDAALELCRYLRRVTGRAIRPGPRGDTSSVVLHVGPDDFALEHAPEMRGLHADGYILKHVTVDGRDHVVMGGVRSLSSWWAMEQFLMRFAGVRWLFPGDPRYGEIVPSRPTITIDRGLDEVHEPDYVARANCFMHYYAPGTAYLRRGPTEGWGYGSHEWQIMFKREHYEAHPEWFALFTMPERWATSIAEDRTAAAPSVKQAVLRGERRQRWHWDYGNGWQICTSNPQTVEHAVAYARDYFAKYTNAPVVSMGHNDMHGWCECETCRAFISSADPPHSASEQYWHWVNQVAKKLAKTHPDRKITTIAYGAPGTPPRFPLEKNVSVMLTVYHAYHFDIAKRWKEKCRTVDLYSYTWGSEFLGFRHYPHAMRDFLKWGREEMGAISHVTETYGNWAFDGPKYSYMQALMWDVDADPDRIMQRHCEDWFGAAAPPMRAFWDRHEQVYERRGHPRRLLFYQWIGWHAQYDEFDDYTLEDVAVLDDAIDSAERAAGTEADAWRVARVADAWKHTRTFILGKLRFADRNDEVLEEAAGSPDRALKLARELATLQSDRRHYYRLLRAYPVVRAPLAPQELGRRTLQLVSFNSHMLRGYQMSTFEKVTLFSDMRTVLDELCGAVAKYEGSGFWSRIERDDPLHESARMMLARAGREQSPNRLSNGDFETGNLDGWKVTGKATVIGEGDGMVARADGSVTLKQSLPVTPGEHCLLRVRARASARKAGEQVLATDVRFKGDGRPRHEPNLRRLRAIGESDGWRTLRTIFVVPENAKTANVSISTSGEQVWLDVLTLTTIEAGPGPAGDEVADEFSDTRIDDRNWIEATAGRSGFLPAVRDGALVFDARPMATLVSRARFDDLLETGYRLRLHVARGDDLTQDGFLEFGIRTDTESLHTDDSGVYMAHAYIAPGERRDRVMSLSRSAVLKSYWHQESKLKGNAGFDLPRPLATGDVWYTIDVDRKRVTVYAAPDGFTATRETRLGTYEHGMTDIASKGPVHLKLSGWNIRVDQIALKHHRP